MRIVGVAAPDQDHIGIVQVIHGVVENNLAHGGGCPGVLIADIGIIFKDRCV